MPDVVVIGGGIAGVSAAAELAAHGSVVLVERESVLAYHTTGRSAALYFESYGHPASRAFSRASKPFFNDPPDGEGSLLEARGALYIAREDQLGELDAKYEEDDTRTFVRIDGDEVREVQPAVREGYAVAGLHDPTAMDIDVARSHQACVQQFRSRGGQIDLTAPVVELARKGTTWEVSTATEHHEAPVVVNATGAWGDVVAGLAGIEPVGLVPKRRTAFMVPSPGEWSHGPLTAGAEFEFYFKPDGVQFLCSLAEEEPEEPTDARPREIDIALAIDRINAATTLEIRHVRSSWTGQRTFAPDEAPVVGFDPDHEGFFWLVGQGGIGIQSSPGAARYAAGVITEGRAPEDLLRFDVDPDAVSPARFRI